MKIEKEIPIPPRKANMTDNNNIFAIYKQMEPGDSFLIKADKVEDKGSISSNAHAYANRHGVKVVTRQVEGGVRVWLKEIL